MKEAVEKKIKGNLKFKEKKYLLKERELECPA